MKCVKCGEELIPGDSFCTNCGASIPSSPQASTTSIPVPPQPLMYNGQTVNINQQVPVYRYIQNQPIEDQKTPNMLCILSLVLRFASPLVLGILSYVVSNISENLSTLFSGGSSALCYLAAFVIMIYVRVKYPANRFGKILMWIYIINIIVYIILFILVVIACASCISTWNY